MKIAVCMKRVPDTASRIKVAPVSAAPGQVGGRGIDHGGLEYCISPYDEMAVERAVLLREAGTAVEVVVFCLGPQEATKEIRTALAMGADRGVHLVADPESYDAGMTAAALADTLRPGGFQLVLFGNKAADTDAGQVGPRVAHRLGLPFVNLVTQLEIDGNHALLTRAIEGATERIRVALPLAAGAQKGLAEARYPALKGIMAAKKKPIETRELGAGAGGQLQVRSLDLPRSRPPGRILAGGVQAVPELIRLLREDAKVL